MMSSNHQRKQREVIDQIALQVNKNSLKFSTVAPVEDYAHDPRICLTSVHLPHMHLLEKVQTQLIEPLREIEPDLYYYANDSLHVTIKNIRVINNPPHFDDLDIKKAQSIFREVIPQHRKFAINFYRLLLFPTNLALIGTTDEELDNIIFDLDHKLRDSGLPDDKIYINSKYFFSNMTLARFNASLSNEFKQKVNDLSASLKFESYQVDSVSLLTCNAVFNDKNIRGCWKLK